MRAILWSSLVLLSFVCSAQVQFENGPWYASQVRDIAIGYRDGSPVMYAVNMSYTGNPTSRTLVKSTDRGVNWEHFVRVEHPLSVATRRDDPDFILVSTITDGILKSIDGGISWYQVYPNFLARRCVIAPSNPNRIYAAGYAAYQGYVLHTSVDGGETWQPEWTFSVTTNITAITFHPTANVVYVTGVSFGGLPNRGIWRNFIKVSDNLENEEIGSIVVDEHDLLTCPDETLQNEDCRLKNVSNRDRSRPEIG